MFGVLLMGGGLVLYIETAKHLDQSFNSLQMALPLLITGVGMGLVAAGVPGPQADRVSASFKQCTVDRAKEKDPSNLPASCPNPAHPDPNQPPAIGKILAEQGIKAGQQTMINGYGTTLWFVAAGQFLVFLLMFFLPKNVRAEDPSGTGGDVATEDLEPVFTH